MGKQKRSSLEARTIIESIKQINIQISPPRSSESKTSVIGFKTPEKERAFDRRVRCTDDIVSSIQIDSRRKSGRMSRETRIRIRRRACKHWQKDTA